MSTIQVRLISAGALFLLIFLSGFWLSRFAKPYPGILLNVHKLIALGTIAYLAVTISQMHKVSPLGAIHIAAIVVTALFFIATIVAGGLVSVEKPMPAIVGTVHKFFPYLTTLSTAATLSLTLGLK
jgi:hypothetical protein